MLDKSVIFLAYIIPTVNLFLFLNGHYLLVILFLLPFALWFYPDLFPGIIGRFARREYRYDVRFMTNNCFVKPQI